MLAAHAAFMTGVGLPPPTVTGITPTSFYTARWVTFTITGTNFVPGSTTISAALSGGNAYVNSVNTDGTSLSAQIYAPSAGSSVVTVTTPFGSANTQTISASVEPPPMSVSSATRYSGYIDVYGSGFTGTTQAYVSPSSGMSNFTPGYKTVGFLSSTYLFIQIPGITTGGQFFLYDPNTGSGTGWINFS